MTDWHATPLAAIDVEGNGQQPPNLVELAVVPIDVGTAGEPLSWLVRPPLPITAIAQGIHGITNVAVADQPTIDELDAEIRAALHGRVILAHHAHVDIDVLTRELPGWEPAGVLDTLVLARKVLVGRVSSFRLGHLADALGVTGGLPEGLAPHRAAYDALVCARLFGCIAGADDGNTAVNAALDRTQADHDRLF